MDLRGMRPLHYFPFNGNRLYKGTRPLDVDSFPRTISMFNLSFNEGNEPLSITFNKMVWKFSCL